MDNSGGSVSSGGMGDSAGEAVFESSVAASETFEAPQEQVITAPAGVDQSAQAQSIMDIPGVAHEKLEGLANMPDEAGEVESEAMEDEAPESDEEPDEVEEFREKPERKKPEKKKLEQEVMLAQAEALKFMAKILLNESNKDLGNKELEELIKKLKELLEKVGKSEGPDKLSLIDIILASILTLLSVQDKIVQATIKEVNSTTK